MKGMMSTGVNVTANYLSENTQLTTRAYEPAVAYNTTKIPTIININIDK
jgi:hypothetical protein